jgi:hypothetical protein
MQTRARPPRVLQTVSPPGGWWREKESAHKGARRDDARTSSMPHGATLPGLLLHYCRRAWGPLASSIGVLELLVVLVSASLMACGFRSHGTDFKTPEGIEHILNISPRSVPSRVPPARRSTRPRGRSASSMARAARRHPGQRAPTISGSACKRWRRCRWTMATRGRCS